MSKSKKDNLIKAKVACLKGNLKENTDTIQLIVPVDEEKGFSEEEDIVVLKCSEFPKKENETLKKDNKELSLRLKDVTRRINELNSLLNDL